MEVETSGVRAATQLVLRNPARPPSASELRNSSAQKWAGNCLIAAGRGWFAFMSVLRNYFGRILIDSFSTSSLTFSCLMAILCRPDRWLHRPGWTPPGVGTHMPSRAGHLPGPRLPGPYSPAHLPRMWLYPVNHLCASRGYPLQYSWASVVAQMVKNLPAMRETWVPPWVGKIRWRRAWQPTPVFWPGESHGQRSLVGYSPPGHTESDMAEWLSSYNIPK